VVNIFPQLVHEYTDFSLEGKKVAIPYCIVHQPGESHDPKKTTRTSKFKNFAGKGTPEEIKKAVIAEATAKNFNLQQASSAQIHHFMLENGIGIDCSGFVYNVLDKYLLETLGKSLGKFVQIYPGIKGKIEQRIFSHNRVRKCSAKTLTSDLNTIKISAVKDIQPGDMIRFTLPTWAGKHIGIITEVIKDTIIYAHSGEKSKEGGPHFAEIKILDPQKDLGEQKWLEKHENGSSYKEHAFHPEKGDSVRRLKIFA
jgi:hypothetical protein